MSPTSYRTAPPRVVVEANATNDLADRNQESDPFRRQRSFIYCSTVRRFEVGLRPSDGREEQGDQHGHRQRHRTDRRRHPSARRRGRRHGHRHLMPAASDDGDRAGDPGDADLGAVADPSCGADGVHAGPPALPDRRRAVPTTDLEATNS